MTDNSRGLRDRAKAEAERLAQHITHTNLAAAWTARAAKAEAIRTAAAEHFGIDLDLTDIGIDPEHQLGTLFIRADNDVVLRCEVEGDNVEFHLAVGGTDEEPPTEGPAVATLAELGTALVRHTNAATWSLSTWAGHLLQADQFASIAAEDQAAADTYAEAA